MTKADKPSPESHVSENELRYGDAMEELETIVSALEADDADIDELAAQVARASELISECREKLGMTRNAVEEILSSIDSDDIESSER